MKFTLSWLKDHLETTASLDEILEALTDLGLEVENVDDPARMLGDFTICRIVEAKQHPNADKLRLCRVEAWPNGADGSSEEVQVVCGAPNARTGLIGVFAKPGTYVPGTDLLLQPGEIRGEKSMGMLCSERELMISDEHDGIIELPEDAPLGARFIDYAGLNDPVIEIAITPNRSDALGVRGIARDLAARGLGTLIEQPVEPVPGLFPCPIGVTLHPEVADKACPLFAGRLIRGVRNGPSPDWLQQRLRAIGLRPINALVDMTNYITYDRGRPLHVFDADKIKGDIEVRFARPGETLLALDGKDYALDESMTMICDADGPEGIGGVMGGEETGCTEETVNVFIESAYFDPVRTAATGRKLKIHSDARYRFERGVDPAFTPEGLEMATEMVFQLCGGEPSDVVIAGAAPDTSLTVPLRPGRVESLVGMDIPAKTQVAILEALGFSVSGNGHTLSVAVPSWRPDVRGEVDLVEEVGRVASLTRLEAKPLPRPDAGITASVLTPLQSRTVGARRALAAAGFDECVTYTFIPQEHAALFGGGDAPRQVNNPISVEMSDMRPSILPALLAAAARNQARGFIDLALFEVGMDFAGAEPGEEREMASGILVGHTSPRHWSGARRAVDLHDARSAAEAALAAIGAPVEKLMIMRDAPPWYHPGRSGALKLGPKNTLAVFGELHPKIVRTFDLKSPVMGFEIALENLPYPKAKTRAKTRTALELTDLQAVERDFAFVVDERVEAEAIVRAARAADKKLIERVRVFDHFGGKRAEAQLGEGKKSIAVSVLLQPKEHTLMDKQIEEVASRIIASVEKATGGTLRG